MNIIKRSDAKARGLKRYFTGKPCSKGHLVERLVTSGVCVRCNAERSKLIKRDETVARNARAAGWFTYPLHPDDVATALAFCQGLDMQRGRMPHIHQPRALPAVATPMPEYTEEMRREVLRRREEIITRSMPTPSYNDDNLSPEEMAR